MFIYKRVGGFIESYVFFLITRILVRALEKSWKIKKKKIYQKKFHREKIFAGGPDFIEPLPSLARP